MGEAQLDGNFSFVRRATSAEREKYGKEGGGVYGRLH